MLLKQLLCIYALQQLHSKYIAVPTVQSPCTSWHRILRSGKGCTSAPSAWVWTLAGIQAKKQLPYGCYWPERQLRELDTSPKWMFNNLFLQIIVSLKGTQCQVFIKLFYSSFSYLLGNNLLLLCLLTPIGKLPLTCSLRVRSRPYGLNSEVPLQPMDKAGLFMSMAERSPPQTGWDCSARR